eukprot:scaffold21648_cov18-Tisochrysis_lutea.AAC.5
MPLARPVSRSSALAMQAKGPGKLAWRAAVQACTYSKGPGKRVCELPVHVLQGVWLSYVNPTSITGAMQAYSLDPATQCHTSTPTSLLKSSKIDPDGLCPRLERKCKLNEKEQSRLILLRWGKCSRAVARRHFSFHLQGGKKIVRAVAKHHFEQQSRLILLNRGRVYFQWQNIILRNIMPDPAEVG